MKQQTKMAKPTPIDSVIRHLEDAAALLSDIELSTSIPRDMLFDATPTERVMTAFSLLSSSISRALKHKS